MEEDQPVVRERVSRPRTRRERRLRRRARLARRPTAIGRHPYRTIGVFIVLGLTPVWVSLGSALTNPGYGGSLPSRFAEWARNNGASSVVNWAENLWYSHHQPPVGGKLAKGAIPPPPSATSSATSHLTAHLAEPASIKPFVRTPVAGEGVWHPVGRKVDGLTGLFETYLRPDPIHTTTVVGVAWMDMKLLRATLYSGSTIPGGGPYPNTAPIEPGAAKSLVAAFNAGFLMSNANGGYYTNRRLVLPLRTAAASFVIYRNGTANIIAWQKGDLTSNIVAVRQNLSLLVVNGKPVSGLNANDTSLWGHTLGNQVYVWRSGIGVTRNGALVYVGGPGLNVTTLANVLARAGAIRAMEFDINTDWVNLTTYDPSSATAPATPANGTELLSAMVGTPARYFESWWTRDFVTVSARTKTG